jgi:hypothetical protein
MYNNKKIGPRTEPWGTPHLVSFRADVKFSNTRLVLYITYVLFQRTVSDVSGQSTGPISKVTIYLRCVTLKKNDDFIYTVAWTTKQAYYVDDR